MYEDIMDEYSDKTVTMERNPFTGIYGLSVHPCKHANVLKMFIDTANEHGKKLEVH